MGGLFDSCCVSSRYQNQMLRWLGAWVIIDSNVSLCVMDRRGVDTGWPSSPCCTSPRLLRRRIPPAIPRPTGRQTDTKRKIEMQTVTRAGSSRAGESINMPDGGASLTCVTFLPSKALTNDWFSTVILSSGAGKPISHDKPPLKKSHKKRGEGR